MSENSIVKIDTIQNRIYTIRGVQVMLDKDLAVFYDVKPIRLREQVKRNIKRFPADFMFQLTDEEVGYMVSQNAIPSKQHLGGSLPFVFTEQGVAAISAVLTGERADRMNRPLPRSLFYYNCIYFYKQVAPIGAALFIVFSPGLFKRLNCYP